MGWEEKGRYDMVELYCIITGIPYQTMSRCKQADVDRLIGPNITWAQKPLDVEGLPMPSKVKIKGMWMIVPKDLELEPFGQKMAVDSEIERINTSTLSDIDKAFERIISTCCIYFYRQLTGEKDFDYDKAMEQRKWLENASICELLPVSIFFSQRSTGSQKSKAKLFGLNRTMTRLAQGWRSLIGTRSKQSITSVEAT